MNRPVYDRDVVVVPDRPRRRGRLLGAVVALLLLVVIVAVVLVLVIKGTSSNSAKKDVTVASCSAPGGRPTPGDGNDPESQLQDEQLRDPVKFTDAQGNTVSEGVRIGGQRGGRRERQLETHR